MAGEIELPTLIQRIRVLDSDLMRSEQRAGVWQQRVSSSMEEGAAATDKVTAAEQDLTKATDRGTAANENRRRSIIRDQPIMADRLRTEVQAVRTQQEAIRLEFMAARQRAQENADLRARTALIDAHVRSLNALERQAGGTAAELAQMDIKSRAAQSKKLGFGDDTALLALGAGTAAAGGGGRGRGGIGGIFGRMRGASDGGKSVGLTALGTMGMFTMPTLIAGMSVLAGIASALTGGLVLASAAMAPMVGYAASIASSMIATKTAIPLFKALVAPANALSKFMETQQNQRTAFMSTKPTAKQLVAFNAAQQKALTQQEAASNLSPSGIAYAKTLSAFQNTVVQPITNRAQDALFPHLTRFFKEIAPLIPTVSKGLAQIADAIGGVAERFGKLLGSASWIRMIGPLMKQDASIVANFGHTLAMLADSFLHVLYAAMPLVKVMQAHQAVMAQNLDRWVQAASASGKLSAFFTHLASKAGGFTAAMGQFFQALLHIGEIATRVNTLSKPGGLLHMMTRFNDFTKSGRGIETIYRWLANSRAVLIDMGKFIGNLLQLLTGFGSQGGGVDKFFRDLNSTLIPALRELKASMGGWIPVLLHAIVELLSAAAKLDSTFTFKPVAQLANGLASVANNIAGIVRQLPGLYTVLSYGLSGLLISKWLKSLGSLVGVKGLFGGAGKGDPALNGSARALTGAASALTEAAGALRGAAVAGAEAGAAGAAAGRGGLIGAFQRGRRGALTEPPLMPLSSVIGSGRTPWRSTTPEPFTPYYPMGVSGRPFGPENQPLGFWGRMGARGSALRGGIGAGVTGFAERLGAITSGARFSRGIGAAGIGLALGGSLTASALRGPSGTSGTSGRNLGASALQGASLGAGVGLMFGPEGAAIGAAVGGIGGLTLALLTSKSAAQKHAEAMKQAMAREKQAIDAVGQSLADAMQADGFKRGAAYSDALFQSLKQAPGAIDSMAKFGLTIKDVQGYMDGNQTSVTKVTDALAHQGTQASSLKTVLDDLTASQGKALASSDNVARTYGIVTDHMKLVSADAADASRKIQILNAAKADPHVNVNSQEYQNKMRAAETAWAKLQKDTKGGITPKVNLGLVLPRGGDVLTANAKKTADDANAALNRALADPKVKAHSKTLTDLIARAKQATQDYLKFQGTSRADLTPVSNSFLPGTSQDVKGAKGDKADAIYSNQWAKQSEMVRTFRGEVKDTLSAVKDQIAKINAAAINPNVSTKKLKEYEAELVRLERGLKSLPGGADSKLPPVTPAVPRSISARIQDIADTYADRKAAARAAAAARKARAAAAAEAARERAHRDHVLATGTPAEVLAEKISMLTPKARANLDTLTANVRTVFSKLSGYGTGAVNEGLSLLGQGILRKGETMAAGLRRILAQIRAAAVAPLPAGWSFTLPALPPVSRPVRRVAHFGAQAAGGPVTAHMPHWVGERGPEIFEPSANGRILNHQQAAGMGGSASYATSFNFYGNIVATDIKAIMRQAARMAQNAAIGGLAPDHAMALTGIPA